MRKSVAGLIVALAGAGWLSTAQAADFSAPILDAPGVDWSGFYAGAHAGYGWGDRHWQGETFSFAINSDRFRYDPDGVLLGAQVGYNWQKDQFVFGLEADIAWARLRDSVSEDFGSGRLGVNIGATAEVTWLATLRGRAGVTFDRVLLYGTGGIAFAGVKDVNVTRTGPFDTTASDSAGATHSGWTAGLGAEALLTDQLSVKLEYLHASFNRKSFNYDLFTLGPAGDETLGSAKLKINTVRIGFNYHF